MHDWIEKFIRYNNAGGSLARADKSRCFCRLCIAMQCIELTASLRVPEILPGGGFVASVGEASADHREDARSKVTAMDPRQDEEQIAFACEIGLEPVESERDNGQDR